MRGRTHNYTVLLLRCGNSSFHASPALNHCVGRNSTFQNFIPSNNLSSFRVEVLRHSFNEPSLQLRFVFQSVIVNSLLTFIAMLPTEFRCFVSANVNILAREKRADFVHDVFQKLNSAVVPCAINVFEYSPFRFNRNTLSCATEPRVGANGSHRMAGQFYFRNNGDVSSLSISNNVFDLLLRVITFAHMISELIHAVRTKTRKLWIFFDFYAPALVFG